MGTLTPRFAKLTVSIPLFPHAIINPVAIMVAGRVYISVLKAILSCLSGCDRAVRARAKSGARNVTVIVVINACHTVNIVTRSHSELPRSAVEGGDGEDEGVRVRNSIIAPKNGANPKIIGMAAHSQVTIGGRGRQYAILRRRLSIRLSS